jgi:sulfonate transport system permease protein
VLWELAAGRWIDPFGFSSPLRIVRHLADWMREGVVLSRRDFLARVLDPITVAANGILREALAPLFIIWLGIGELSKIVLASTLTFFLTFYASFSGLRAVESADRDVARVMGASERQIFLKVLPPAASPWIVAALKVGVPFSRSAPSSASSRPPRAGAAT